MHLISGMGKGLMLLLMPIKELIIIGYDIAVWVYVQTQKCVQAFINCLYFVTKDQKLLNRNLPLDIIFLI